MSGISIHISIHIRCFAMSRLLHLQCSAIRYWTDRTQVLAYKPCTSATLWEAPIRKRRFATSSSLIVVCKWWSFLIMTGSRRGNACMTLCGLFSTASYIYDGGGELFSKNIALNCCIVFPSAHSAFNAPTRTCRGSMHTLKGFVWPIALSPGGWKADIDGWCTVSFRALGLEMLIFKTHVELGTEMLKNVQWHPLLHWTALCKKGEIVLTLLWR